MDRTQTPAAIGQVLSEVQTSVIPNPFSNPSGFSQIEFECDECEDVGMISDGRTSRQCGCRVRRAAKVAFERIPPEFRNVELKSLIPNASRHPKQAALIPAIQAEPDASYLLAGRFGSGKTMCMWALYRHVLEQNDHKWVACTLTELLDEFRGFIQFSQGKGDPVYPSITPAALRSGHKWSIFLDDIDKARPTEYAAEQFFEILNVIYEQKHQLVATTNLGVADLIEHFNRADPRYGGAIVRRLTHGVKVFEMF